MNVILEAQHAVGRAQLRGVGQYALCMIDALLKRRQNEYALTFFDKGREMGNRERAEQHFGRYHVPFYECNTLDYRVATRDDAVFAEKSYNDYTGARGDVFHFMNLISIPTNLQGRMVVTVHDMLFCTFPELTPAHNIPIYSKGFERLQKMKPYIIAISDYSKQQLMRRADFDETRVFTVPNGWDRSRIYFEEDPGRAGLRAMGINGEYILFLSALDLYKNPIRLIEAFDRIAGKFSGLQLVLAGKSYFDDDAPIREAAEKSAYRKRILFPGFVDERQKRLLYSNALCFAFPSLMEGFGLPPLEAMGCGCPVVASNATSIPEVCGDAAILFDPYSVEQLASALEGVVQSKTLRDEMKAKGLAQSAKYSWDKSAEQVEKIYRLAVESETTGGRQ